MQTEPTPAASALRVFLADDHPIVLAGMKALVLADPGLELVGEAMDGGSALRQALELRPDVAVLDLSMPGLNGMEVARRLLASCPQCRVLVLTVHEDPAYLREALKIGASGYLLKRSATEALIRGIHSVAAGDTYLDSGIAGHIIGPAPVRTTNGAEPATTPELSEREADVVRMAAAGHSSKTIARQMHISVKTVDTYKARAMAKLGFHGRVELVRYAVAKGWFREN